MVVVVSIGHIFRHGLYNYYKKKFTAISKSGMSEEERGVGIPALSSPEFCSTDPHGRSLSSDHLNGDY